MLFFRHLPGSRSHAIFSLTLVQRKHAGSGLPPRSSSPHLGDLGTLHGVGVGHGSLRCTTVRFSLSWDSHMTHCVVYWYVSPVADDVDPASILRDASVRVTLVILTPSWRMCALHCAWVKGAGRAARQCGSPCPRALCSTAG
jgi:hypothetical protein